MNYKRFLSFVLPVAVILSACQRVFATDIPSETNVTASRDIENYHQIITIETETLIEDDITESTYAITEATVFPQDFLAYGSRINKGTDTEAHKTTVYASNNGAYQQKNDEQWVSSATAEPLFASISVFPYDSFLALVDIFEAQGNVLESEDEYVIVYAGYDEALNREISAVMKQFPATGTKYQVEITLDKDNELIRSIILESETAGAGGNRTTRQNFTAQFSKYNMNTPREMVQE